MEAAARYKITGVPKGLDAELARRMVLEPIAGPAEDDKTIIAHALQVHERWRDRVWELADAGHPALAGVTTQAGRRARRKAEERAARLRDRAEECPPGFFRQ